jgi:hypothetical protein
MTSNYVELDTLYVHRVVTEVVGLNPSFTCTYPCTFPIQTSLLVIDSFVETLNVGMYVHIYQPKASN